MSALIQIKEYGRKFEQADATKNKNHMLNATITASSFENGSSFTADKVKDGSTEATSRWASEYRDANNKYLVECSVF